MAGSKLELFRISIYVFFPVGVYYAFNKPGFIDDYLREMREKLRPKSDLTSKDLVRLVSEYEAKEKALLENNKSSS